MRHCTNEDSNKIEKPVVHLFKFLILAKSVGPGRKACRKAFVKYPGLAQNRQKEKGLYRIILNGCSGLVFS